MYIVFHIYNLSNKCFDSFVFDSVKSNKLKDNICDLDLNKTRKRFGAVFRVDGYFLSVFIRELKISQIYLDMVIKNILNITKSVPEGNSIDVKFHLVEPKSEVLDYAWNDRISNLILEKSELDNAMSWLSTLGGAFSALGDDFENCAKVAGKISIQQFKIAFRLGEPNLVARCRLYMALSLIQLGKLTIAKTIVLKQYQIAKDFKDTRLQNMCKGIWAKLQYMYKLKGQEKKYVNYK